VALIQTKSGAFQPIVEILRRKSSSLITTESDPTESMEFTGTSYQMREPWTLPTLRVKPLLLVWVLLLMVVCQHPGEVLVCDGYLTDMEMATRAGRP